MAGVDERQMIDHAIAGGLPHPGVAAVACRQVDRSGIAEAGHPGVCGISAGNILQPGVGQCRAA